MEQQEMKIVVAYDGSDEADAAVAAMPRAGLPPRARAVVLAVDDGALPPAGDLPEAMPPSAETAVTRGGRREAWALARAFDVATRGRDRVRELFPGWEVEAEGVAGSPTWGILAKTDSWLPDLAILGSHGRSFLGRILLGSVSQMIATEARCSVHIARGRVGREGLPVRLVVGLDGSPDSLAAIESVASRCWPAGSSVLVVCAAGAVYPRVAPPLGTRVPPAIEETEEHHHGRLQEAAERSVKLLAEAGLTADATFTKGRAAHALVTHAEATEAECIFVGARGLSLLDRVLLGSVSAAVTSRAHCSVEIVRRARREERG